MLTCWMTEVAIEVGLGSAKGLEVAKLALEEDNGLCAIVEQRKWKGIEN